MCLLIAISSTLKDRCWLFGLGETSFYDGVPDCYTSVWLCTCLVVGLEVSVGAWKRSKIGKDLRSERCWIFQAVAVDDAMAGARLPTEFCKMF